MRILIADADEAFLKKMQSSLSDRGHEARIATDGLNCLANLQGVIPDVLVIERELLWGGCDGVLATMRDDRTMAQIPVVLLTADSQGDFDGPTYPNVAARVQKPFPFDDLLETIVFALRTEELANAATEMES